MGARDLHNLCHNSEVHTDDALFPSLEVDGGLVVPPLVDVAQVVELAALYRQIRLQLH